MSRHRKAGNIYGYVPHTLRAPTARSLSLVIAVNEATRMSTVPSRRAPLSKSISAKSRGVNKTLILIPSGVQANRNSIEAGETPMFQTPSQFYISLGVYIMMRSN